MKNEKSSQEKNLEKDLEDEEDEKENQDFANQVLDDTSEIDLAEATEVDEAIDQEVEQVDRNFLLKSQFLTV